MKRIILNVLAIFLIGQTLFAQVPILNESQAQIQQSVSDFEVNSSAQFRSGTLEEALDEAFDNTVADSEITAFNAAMMLPDGTIWKRAIGVANGEQIPTDLTTDHLMGMGSITKSFVSTTLLMMAEDGLLSLDDSIGLYLPPYPNIDGRVTIRQLLNHRTGFNDYLNENQASSTAWVLDPDYIWGIGEVLNDFVLEPNFEPGVSWSYSNTNYLLAGLVIESIVGTAWYEEVRTRIIDPLELTSTFAHPFEDYGNLPYAHAFTDIDGSGAYVDIELAGYTLDGLYSMGASAGCLVSTPEDLVKFTNALHGGGLLLPSSLEEMYVNHSPGAGITYGLGVYRLNLGGGVYSWGHNGSIVYQSLAYYIFDKKISIAVQQNDGRVDNGNQTYVHHTDVFYALFDAFCNYETVSAVDLLDHTINIFPNPSNGYFTIEMLENNENIDVIDVVGKVVKELNLNAGVHQVDLTDLEQGIYFVRMGEVMEKIMVH